MENFFRQSGLKGKEIVEGEVLVERTRILEWAYSAVTCLLLSLVERTLKGERKEEWKGERSERSCRTFDSTPSSKIRTKFENVLVGRRLEGGLNEEKNETFLFFERKIFFLVIHAHYIFVTHLLTIFQISSFPSLSPVLFPLYLQFFPLTTRHHFME